MHIFVRRGGPNYQTGLAKMRVLGEELGLPLEVCHGSSLYLFFCYALLPMYVMITLSKFLLFILCTGSTCVFLLGKKKQIPKQHAKG